MLKLLYFFGAVVLDCHPVIMTAGRRRALENDAVALDLAMQEIERLRGMIVERGPTDD